MAIEWYFAWDDKDFGPFSPTQLRELAASGQLRPQDAVWKEGMARRVLACQVKNLFPTEAQTAPAEGLAQEAVPLSGAEVDPETGGSPTPTPAAPAPPAAGPILTACPEAEPTRALAVPAAQEVAPRGVLPARAEARKWRVLGVKGGVLLSQDGFVVRFKKKCPKCGQEDSSVTTQPIRGGVTRTAFFCPKCRKSQPVEIQTV